MTKFLADLPFAITMQNFKVVATANLWVYNAENFCVSFFNQFASIFTYEGGKSKKKFLAYLMIRVTLLRLKEERKVVASGQG